MKSVVMILLVLLFGSISEGIAQIKFFDGNLKEAFQKAKTEKKDLFVDFYAEWCSPCKLMAKEVFLTAEIGKYFNEHFVCCKLDAEKDENKAIAQRYGVNAFPTMVFLNADGKELRKVRGAVPASVLLKEAKVVTGEELDYEQLYQKYKKNKKDLESAQQLLMEAPSFIQTVEGYDRDKWSARIDALFGEYLKTKPFEKMINGADFIILTTFHPQIEKEDPIFDFMVKNFEKYAAEVDRQIVADYLIGMNNAYVITLCKKGNLDYKKRLNRINEDLKPIYADMTFGSLSVSQAVTYLADATYSLYRNDDQQFFTQMEKYFTGVGDSLSVNDYTQPIEDLYAFHQGKLPEQAQVKCIDWISKALEKDMQPSLKTRLLIMLGECYGGTGNPGKAKQCYNQAFIVSAQITNQGMMKQLQGVIQSKLQGL